MFQGHKQPQKVRKFCSRDTGESLQEEQENCGAATPQPLTGRWTEGRNSTSQCPCQGRPECSDNLSTWTSSDLQS